MVSLAGAGATGAPFATWLTTGVTVLTTGSAAGKLAEGVSMDSTSACAGAHVQHAATAIASPMTRTIWVPMPA
jgi:hypothetical protein